MFEITLEVACQLFDTEVKLQNQSRSKLNDTIEGYHGLPVSDSMNQANFVLTDIDIFVAPV